MNHIDIYYHPETNELYLFEFIGSCFIVETWNDIFRTYNTDGFIFIGIL